MNVQQGYNQWASQYDTNQNKTRDMEGDALRSMLSSLSFEHCLEIGCGTGKNTSWLLKKANRVTAVDFSEEMLAKAQSKISAPNVQFRQFDITQPWNFGEGFCDLVTFSLVLEHIADLDRIFQQAAAALKKGGYVYLGELHPFKQYAGSKARFETENGTQVLECFTHHVSDFVQIPQKYGLAVENLNEHFDDNDRNHLPRILTILLKKA